MQSRRASPLLTATKLLYDGRLGGYNRRSSYLQRATSPDAIDLAFGDPQETASPALVKVLQDALEPQDHRWYAYKRGYAPAQEHVAERLTRELGTTFLPADVTLTNGQFGGLSSVLHSTTAPGDEIVYFEPSWFYYAPMIASVGGVPLGLPVDRTSSLPDLDALASAISTRTAAVIINSPNNPTGVVYPDSWYRDLAEVLEQASRRINRAVVLVSDEAYRHVVFDGSSSPSPARHYKQTVLLHTYTKSLLLPGIRIGYVALPEHMPGRTDLREGIELAQLVLGWTFPANHLMYVLDALEDHRVDMRLLRDRRDHMVAGLRELGLGVDVPQGTLYCWVTSPGSDWEHALQLEQESLFVLPGSVMGGPGHVRVALTADAPVLDEALIRWSRVLARTTETT